MSFVMTFYVLEIKYAQCNAVSPLGQSTLSFIALPRTMKNLLDATPSTVREWIVFSSATLQHTKYLNDIQVHPFFQFGSASF